jgi:hypothetical protein
LLNSVNKSLFDLKKSKYHITRSWILLVCFVAGQYMVYAHQHNISKSAAISHNRSKDMSRQTVMEKCQLCDVMHHNAMVATTPVYFNPVVVAGHFFKVYNYTFTSIQLILSGGRAPPHSIYS